MPKIVMMFFTGLTFLSLTPHGWAEAYDDGSAVCTFQIPKQNSAKQCLIQLTSYTTKLKKIEDPGFLAKLMGNNDNISGTTELRNLPCHLIAEFCFSNLQTRTNDLILCLIDAQEARMGSPSEQITQKFCLAALKKAEDQKIASCFAEHKVLFKELNETFLEKCIGIDPDNGPRNDVDADNDLSSPQAFIKPLNKDI